MKTLSIILLVWLLWDPSSTPAVKYRVHVGSSSGCYTRTIPVGNRTFWRLKLPRTMAAFIAVGAVKGGQEALSEECVYLPRDLRK